MPVKIGDNLTLEDNKLSAVYKELYTKLNRAYAWTNTQSSSSDNSYGIIINDSKTFSTLIDCNQAPVLYCFLATDNYNGDLYYIIDGKLYKTKNITQVGDRVTYKKCTQTVAIDFDGNTYDASNGNIINNGLLIDYIPEVDGSQRYGITKDGYLYRNIGSTSPVKYSNLQGWSFITQDYSNGAGICDGKLYYLSSPEAIKYTNISNFVECYNDDSNCWGITTTGEIYYSNLSTTNISSATPLLSNVKKFFYKGQGGGYAATNDNNLYYVSASSAIKINSASGLNFSKIAGGSSYTYGIANNKLYYITSSSVEEIMSNNHYIDIVGAYAKTPSSHFYIVSMGNYVSSTETRYTVKNPTINDTLYQDTIPSQNNIEKIISASNSQLVSNSYNKVYNRNPYLDKSFTGIPSETQSRTVSAIDLLIATNPNYN